jgi:hypothetical protein
LPAKDDARISVCGGRAVDKSVHAIRA